MKIEVDREKAIMLNEAYHTLGTKNRNEPHLSDDLYCPMKAVCRITGLKEKWSRRTKARFNIGNDLHGEFELPFKHKEFSICYKDCSWGHPDVVLEAAHYTYPNLCDIPIAPLEFKHTTLPIHSEMDIPAKWLKQLKLECVYMSYHLNTAVIFGWLAILEIVPGIGTVYKVTFTKRELEEAEKDHDKFLYNLNYGLVHKDYKDVNVVLPECPDCQFNHVEGCPRRPIWYR